MIYARMPLVFLAFAAILNAQTDLGRIVPLGRDLHIAAFGDFGSGSRHQKDVAAALAQHHQQQPFDFGLTLGDNFYRCGVRSVDDPIWQTRWENLYSPLHVPFYATLGNHDYGHPAAICPTFSASPKAEIARTARSESWKMPTAYYTFVAGPARFIAIDTEGWSQDQLEWIGKILAASASEPDVSWRVVYGHHPLYTSGHHINERRIKQLRRELLPVLQEGHVDVYIAGHDHDMERFERSGLDHLIGGSGGAELRTPGRAQPGSMFRIAAYGFIDLKITAINMTAQFLDTSLRALEPAPLNRTRSISPRR